MARKSAGIDAAALASAALDSKILDRLSWSTAMLAG
jgi:hypothetical protein